MLKVTSPSGRLCAIPCLRGTLNDSVISKYTKYNGDYEVTPKAHEQTVLDTKNKVMTDNVTVFKIPYYETSNDNGTTVFIASEVN